MSKYLALILGVVVIGLLVYIATMDANPKMVEVQEPRPTEPVFSWQFASEAEENGIPMTRVTLMKDGVAIDAGIYPGSCEEIATIERVEGEIAAALCWWAGGGDELGVFKEGEGYVLKKGVQDEPTAESEGFRGNFETLKPV